MSGYAQQISGVPRVQDDGEVFGSIKNRECSGHVGKDQCGQKQKKRDQGDGPESGPAKI